MQNAIPKLEKNLAPINFTEFDVIEKFDTLNSLKNTNNKISSFLTVQEGCDKFCKFCVVPYTRGSEYSRSINELVSEAKQLVNNGSSEITLLGQNVNAYNFNKNRLSDLILAISKIKDLKRIRYSTSHPIDFTDDLITMHKECKKLMPLVHLPVQSGSNEILKSMNRKHTIEEYLELISKIKAVKPNIKFSSDFIIGYPGETNYDFEKTKELVKKVEFINSYSFMYSARPGTPSSDLKKIDQKQAKDRLIEFQNIAEDLKTKYRKTLINNLSNVLIENKTKDEDKYFGRDEYNNSVIVQSDKNIVGEIKKVTILDGNHNTLYGELTSTLNKTNHAA